VLASQEAGAAEASVFAKASRTCYALVLFAVIAFGWATALSALGVQVVPLSLLPAFSLPICALFLLVAALGFYMYRIGSAHNLRFLRIPSVLIVVASFALLVVFSPAFIGISISFYQTLPSPLQGLILLTLLSAVALFIVSPFLFWKGIKDMKTKLYLRGLRVFRRAESVFYTLIVIYVLLAVFQVPLAFSSSPATASLGMQLWRTAEIGISGIGGILLLALFANTLGKLGDPEILARAVDTAARAPPEPEPLFLGRTAKLKESRKLPESIRESFRQIESDKKFEFSIMGIKYLVLKKGNNFMLLPEMWGGVYLAYFIKLFNPTPTTKKRFKAPLMVPRKKHFSQSIGGLPVAKFRGDFTLPVDVISKTEGNEVKYANGSGIMYLVSRRDPTYGMYSPLAMFSQVDLSEKFNKATILKIMEELSEETH
jgi:hypothetical protein